MPRQGNTVESCIVTSWQVAEGQTVTAAQIVCEVETDKASFEVPAGAEGKVLKILHPEGDDVPVLAPIAVIGSDSENWQAAVGGDSASPASIDASGGAPVSPGAVSDAGPAASAVVANADPVNAGSGANAAGESTAGAGSLVMPAAVSPRARGVAARESLSLAGLSGSGPGGRVIERDVRAALDARPELTAAAKRLAALTAVLPLEGTGFGGRIGIADMEAAGRIRSGTPENAGTSVPYASVAASALAAASSLTAASSESKPVQAAGEYVDTALKGVRRIIAERMVSSLAKSAQLTLNSSAPAKAMLTLRSRFKEGAGGPELAGVTIGDLVLAATARTLVRFPELNAHFRGDSIRTFKAVHLGLAVDTPRGLMVPVIRNADSLSLAGLSAETKRLASACQKGTILPDELTGSTFTVTNLGAFGIESFTPVLNTPEVGILGVCSIVDRSAPDVPGGVEKRMGLSLTIDHQAVDGAPGARFLQALASALATIDLFLLK